MLILVRSGKLISEQALTHSEDDGDSELILYYFSPNNLKIIGEDNLMQRKDDNDVGLTPA